jgi:hypothetical protein
MRAQGGTTGEGVELDLEREREAPLEVKMKKNDV